MMVALLGVALVATSTGVADARPDGPLPADGCETTDLVHRTEYADGERVIVFREVTLDLCVADGSSPYRVRVVEPSTGPT